MEIRYANLQSFAQSKAARTEVRAAAVSELREAYCFAFSYG
jgi:hypothetical protein